MTGTPQTPNLDLTGQGAVRLSLVPLTHLELSIASSTLARERLTLDLRGKAQGLPDGVTCKVTCETSDAHRSSASAKLEVPGWKAGQSLDATLKVELDVVAARLINGATCKLLIEPEFPGAAPLTVEPTREHVPDLHLELAPFPPARNELKVGHAVVVTPRVSEQLQDCWLRLTVIEADDKDGEIDDSDDMRMGLVWHGAEDLAPAEGAASRVWRLGCVAREPESDDDDSKAEAVTLEYLESDERGAYELEAQVEASADEGKTWHLIASSGDEAFATAVRPRLEAFEVTRAEGVCLASGRIDGFDPGLAVPLELTFWALRPATQHLKDRPTRTFHQLTAPRTVILEDNAFSGSAALPLREDEEPFAVLQLPPGLTGGAGHSVLSDGIDYDPTTFFPLEDGELPQPPKKKTDLDVATGACSAQVALVAKREDLLRVPGLGPIELHVRGEKLVLRARLYGDEPYWKSAKPVFSVATHVPDAEPESWKRLGGKVLGGGDYAETTVALTNAAIAGKTVVFRLAVTNEDARLERKVSLGDHDPPEPVESEPTTCEPRILGEQAKITKEQGAIRVAFPTEFFPRPRTSKALTLRFREVVQEAEANQRREDYVTLEWKPTYARKSGSDGLCDADGILRATIDDADALERFDKMKLEVEAYRRHKGYELAPAFAVHGGPARTRAQIDADRHPYGFVLRGGDNDERKTWAGKKRQEQATFVEQLQRDLIQLGHNESGVDGDFGPGTTKQVKAFQTAEAASGLSANGVVSRATASLIKQRLREKTQTTAQ